MKGSGEAFTYEQDGQLYARLFDADVSFIHQHHPLVEPTVAEQGLSLASATDIGLMKLAAINSRGTRRDFVDLYCLRALCPFERLVQLAEKKYSIARAFSTSPSAP